MNKFVFLLTAFPMVLEAAEPKFRQYDLDTKVGVGYGLQLADMNGDKKIDVVLVDKDKVVWYENSSWQKHQISGHLTQRDHVCVTARDIDGDGKAEIAVGAQWNINETTDLAKSGSVFYMQPTKDRVGNWTPVKLHHEPTTHRMHWLKNENGKFDLVVKPLHGRNNRGGKGEGMKVYSYHMPKNTKGKWSISLISDFLHDSHNFHPINWDRDPEEEFLQAAFEGIWLFDRRSGIWKGERLTKNWAGEVRDGKTTSGQRFVTAIEPKHGTTVAVYLKSGNKYERVVLDEAFKDGHALACADFLGTGGDQIVAGWRGMRPRAVPGVKLFVPQKDDYTKWKTYRLSGAEIAVEDIKVADLNGDNKPEIVVAGRQTHNLKIFWNESK